MLLFLYPQSSEPRQQSQQQNDPEDLITYEAKPGDLRFFWQDENDINYANFFMLRKWLRNDGDSLIFAMNGGMFDDKGKPQGLYIQNGTVLAPLDTVQHSYGNFYMQPNGVFYITRDGRPVICTTEQFGSDGNVEFATQSGPMLIINGEMHSKFTPGSLNLHIRNGVGILPNGNVLFALSTKKTNFYNLAAYFKKRGCENALYLDGVISRAYIPEKEWVQLDGSLGVIIAEVQ